jgi:hypothetical protein
MVNQYKENQEPTGNFKWIQMGYVMPHFSFGIIILDYFSGGVAN